MAAVERDRGDSARALETPQILARLPHRPPMLMVDRVLELVPGERIRALKNVSVSEPALVGHFPGRPIFPGVLLVEVIAQAGALLVHATEPFDPEAQPLALLGVDRARFRSPVIPGDSLQVECGIVSRREGIWRLKGEVWVEDRLTAEAVILASVGAKERPGP